LIGFQDRADPPKATKTIYNKFGMVRTLDMGNSSERPSHIKENLLGITISGIRNAFKMGKVLSASSGDMSQNGGEQIWRKGYCEWAHNMAKVCFFLTSRHMIDPLDRPQIILKSQNCSTRLAFKWAGET
jgi:hypothetical protein